MSTRTARPRFEALGPMFAGIRCRGACGRAIEAGEPVWVLPPDTYCQPCGEAVLARSADWQFSGRPSGRRSLTSWGPA